MATSYAFHPNDALLIVDPQIDFFPGGALPVPEGDAIVPILNDWIAAAAQLDIPVVVSRDWHPDDHCSFKAQGGPWPPHCVQGTEGARFHPELRLPSDAMVISKAATSDKDPYSDFEGTTPDGQPLAEYLRGQNIARLWIGGLAQDYCVKATAIDACKNGFETHLIVDATRPVDEETGATALEEMKKAGVIF